MSYVRVPPDSTGKKLLTREYVLGPDTVQVPVYHLADKDNPDHMQSVDILGQASVRFAEGSPTIDAFGGLRVSNAQMIGSYEYTQGDMSDMFFDEIGGNGSINYLPVESATSLDVDGTAFSRSERSTNRYHYYQPGVGTLCILTLALSDNGKANNQRSWGYGDHENGLFFKLVGTEMNVCLRSSSIGNYFERIGSGIEDTFTITVNDATGITVGMHVEGSGVIGYTVVTDITGNTITIDKALHSNRTNSTFLFKEIVETLVPQSQWNGDKLDGTGDSGVVLDLSKANFYWLDFAWLGVGSVRMGILGPDGSRWTCHTFENPNSKSGPYMATGSLPLHWHNENLGATSGSSSIKAICAAVYSESRTDYTYWRFADAETASAKSVGSDTVFNPIISLRPKVEYANKSNRVGIYPEQLSVFVSGGPVVISIFDDAVISKNGDGTLLTSHADWTYGEETTQFTSAATEMSGGSRFKTFYLDAGSHDIDLKPFYELNDEGYHVHYDGQTTQLMTVAGKKMNSGDTVTVRACISYRELR